MEPQTTQDPPTQTPPAPGPAAPAPMNGPAGPGATPSAPASLAKKSNNKMFLWVGLAIAVIVIAWFLMKG